MPELLFFRDREMQLRSPLHQERIVLGRAPESDFTLPDRVISRRQCEIVRRGTGYQLIDLSGRGTPVSNRVATDRGTSLRDGDEIRLGGFTVVYSSMSSHTTSESTSLRTHERATAAHRANAQGIRARNAWLRPLSGTDEPTPLVAEEGFTLTVGSAPTGPKRCKIDDRYVSAEHFRISYRQGRWVLSDRTSTNGTIVDGLRVIECVLQERATIRIGEQSLAFRQDVDSTQLTSGEALPGLVTRDPSMRAVVESVHRVASSVIPVMIHGETGVGKDVVARAIHQLSRRADGPFVALNCGALSRDLIESELFGHERGAFTGADRARAGAFEEANGGTLFLDEIGDLSLSLQVKLLRALERGEVRRLGANRSQTVDIRVVSATHRDLRAGVEEGTFREDLYYRLCVAPVAIPPLRQRVSDIIPMAEYFASQMVPETKMTFVPAARARLETHPWYGNARELRNTVQLALLNRSGTTISADDLVFTPSPSRRPGNSTLRVAGRTLDEIERESYRMALERHDGDRKSAMQELGVARSTFFRKMDELGLHELETVAIGARNRSG